MLQRFIIIGIIAALAGPADTKPEIREVINITASKSNLGFVILDSRNTATCDNTPEALITEANKRNDAIVKTDFISTHCFILIPFQAEIASPIE